MNRSRPLVIVFGLLLAGAFLWMALAGPMLVHFKFGPLQGDSRLIVWNPNRNKEPERFGTQYLAAIHSQQCRETMAKLDIPYQEKGETCEKQERRALVGLCSLVERRDNGERAWLLFHCPEQAHPEVLADVGLSLHIKERVWVLEGYERIN